MNQKRYIHYLLPVGAVALWMLSSCSNRLDEVQEAVSPYIEFGTQTLKVQTRLSDTDGGMRNEFKEGDSFGVFGYCVPHQVGGDTPDYAAGSSVWTSKMSNAVPDVFNNQKVTLNADGIWFYNWKDMNSGSYNPKYWYANGKDTEGNSVSEITNAQNYRYDFFAYYPYGTNVFVWSTEKGAPKVEVSIPQTGGDNMKLSDNPDAMLSVIHNYQRKINSKLSFSFNHVFTALGFEVNNFSERRLEIHSIKMTGTFWKSLTVDFSNGHYTYNSSNTYTGTYVIFDEAGGNTLVLEAPGEGQSVTTAESPVGGEYLRLLPGGFDGEENYLGPIPADENDVIKLVIDYTFGAERKTASFSRPATFLPQSGTQYTSQLNFVGNAFVLQFVIDNSESWEDGGSDNEGDITFE